MKISPKGVIKGWGEAMEKMVVGDKIEVAMGASLGITF